MYVPKSAAREILSAVSTPHYDAFQNLHATACKNQEVSHEKPCIFFSAPRRRASSLLCAPFVHRFLRRQFGLSETVSRASLGSKIPSSVRKKTLTADELGSAFGIWENAPSFLRGYVYEPSIVPNTLVFGCVEVEPERAEETAKDFLSKMNLGKQVCVVYDKKIAVADGKYILLVMGEEDVCTALEAAFHESVAALSEK